MREPAARRRLMAGLVFLSAGSLLLLATDPMGRNPASHAAPLLMLAGTVLAAIDAFRDAFRKE